MSKRKIFVLDTNVLMHDPTALYRFEEHDLFIPMVVLEELDAAKKGTSEVSRNARQVSRFLDEMMRGKDHAQIEKGLALVSPLSKDARPSNGKGAHGKKPKTPPTAAATCSSRPARPMPRCRR
jgi:PhoH-like ATPase